MWCAFYDEQYQEKWLTQDKTLMLNLYYMFIGTIEKHTIVNQKSLWNKNNFFVWHDQLDYSVFIMVQKVITNSCEHSLKIRKNLLFNDFSCTTCSQEKLIYNKTIIRKIEDKLLTFLVRIQGDICRPIRYFMF